MMIDVNKKTVDITEDLQRIDDEMGDTVNIYGIIKQYALKYLEHDIMIGMQYPPFKSDLIVRKEQALDPLEYYETIEEDIINNVITELIPFLEQLFEKETTVIT